MQKRSLGGVLLGLWLACGLVSQGPLYRESWAFLALSRLRAQVGGELLARGDDAALQAEVAALFAADDKGIPFRGPAQALARLRKVPCDDAFLYRAVLGAFVLPEVADPDGSKIECHDVAVSLFLPYAIPQPGPVTFAVQLVDSSGKERFASVIDHDTALADLRMARASVTLPTHDLPDGTYEVVVHTRFGDAAGKDTDPVLRQPVLVQRGWQARAEAAMASAVVVAASLPEPQQSMLIGCAAEVSRAYRGEPWPEAPRAVRDLDLVERMLANVQQKQPLLTGLTGEVPGMVLVGKDEKGAPQRLGVALRLPPDAMPRPLLLVAGGAPAYDAAANRPNAPTSTHAGWTLAAARAFAPPEAMVLVALESPGNGVAYGEAIERAIAALGSLLPLTGKPVLVAEREAALAACFLLPKLAPQLAGLCLVAGGSLSRQTLGQLSGLRVLGIPAVGQCSDGLRLLIDLLAGKHGEVKPAGEVQVSAASCTPWPLGLMVRGREVRTFVAGGIRR